ncbi:MAG: universal stress protein [Planctomycetota bacterium]
MKNWKAIVVGVDLDFAGTDLSQGSRRALRQAEWIAVRTGASLTLVHSTEGDPYILHQEGQWFVNHEGLSDAGHASLEKELQRLRGMELAAHLAIRKERPFIAIIREVLERKADLAVLGKHEEELDGARIGSVAIKALRKCPCPVWVAKPGTELAPQKVVAATDLSDVGALAIQYAVDIAERFQSELHVIHAYQVPFGEKMVGEKEGRNVDSELHETALAKVKEQTAALDPKTEPILHVGCDSPKRALLDADRKLQPDLFVMGSISRTGIPGLLVGNTAETVLPKLCGSLLVVKPESFESPIA